MKKFIEWILFFLSIVLIWILFALRIGNDFILPMPNKVVVEMIQCVSSSAFYKACLQTLRRTLLSISISFIVGCLFAFTSTKVKFLNMWLNKFILIVRSIPNVALIIVMLFWVSRESTVFLVSFLLLFPIVYQNIYQGLTTIELEWKYLFKII